MPSRDLLGNVSIIIILDYILHEDFLLNEINGMLSKEYNEMLISILRTS